MKKYELYLFDFDGTLFDTMPSLKEGYIDTFKHYGVYDPNEDLTPYLGYSMPKTRATKGVDPSKEREFIDYFHDAINVMKVVNATDTYFDTLDTLNYMFKNNIKFGIVTGSSHFRVHNILKRFGYDYKKLQVIICNEDYKKPKPDPEPILNALKKTGYLNKKDKVLYIGDGPQDIKCCEAAGLKYEIVRRGKSKGTIDSLLDIFK